jgi:hypothetical protein
MAHLYETGFGPYRSQRRSVQLLQRHIATRPLPISGIQQHDFYDIDNEYIQRRWQSHLPQMSMLGPSDSKSKPARTTFQRDLYHFVLPPRWTREQEPFKF